MKITANQIEGWGDTRNAQAELPRLIRKLIAATNQLTELSVLAGDSIYRPGWDGKVTSSNASSWVPEGHSVWEIGCNANITSKANSDYKKRVEEVVKAERKNIHYVFVTPRRWHKKEAWQKDKSSLNEWKNIFVIDADDIEAWLEHAPAVAIEFSEELGLTGFGITSLNKFFESWSQTSSPSISKKAIEFERQQSVETLKQLIENQTQLIIVEADSRDEAIAFCCSALSDHPIQNSAACVNEDEGWRFVDRNPTIKLCISDTYGSKHTASLREGLTIIQPVCHGDFHSFVEESSDRILVTRLKSDDFKKALIELGEEESDARRLTASTGRSWSVYRRLRSTNPAFKTPSWVESADHECLNVLMLVDAWSANKNGDIAFIEALTNKAYEDIETALTRLITVNDSPVLNISNIWKAKSPIELLHLAAPTIPSSLLDRFFRLCKSILEKNDPQLELPEGQRFMAAIYDKVRDESGVIISSILNSLCKLKVFSENSTSANSDNISLGIDNLIRELLFDVDENRWMSLSGYLRSFAEASPDVYLDCLEQSLARSDKPVTALITNTTSAGAMGKCWYSELLWSLELISWNASKLSRVTYILIELSKVPNDSNWSNSPLSTLNSFYRVFSADTLAEPEQKIEILKRVIHNDPEFAWTFILSLVPSAFGNSWIPNAKPKWRDDDAGSDSEKGTYYLHYISWIGETVLNLAAGKPERIAKLFKKYTAFDGEYKQQLIDLVGSVSSFDDLGKEIIHSELRPFLNYRRSDYVNEKIGEDFEKLERIYFANQPKDLLIRYRWLFDTGVHLPEGDKGDFRAMEKLLSQRRTDAIQHVVSELGIIGIKEFKVLVKEQGVLGFHLVQSNIGLTDEELILFMIEQFLDGGAKYKDPFVSGIVNALSYEKLSKFLDILEEKIFTLQLNIDQQVSLLASLPPTKVTFELIDRLSNETQESYWQKVTFGFSINSDVFEFVLLKYIEKGRYISAFSILPHDFKSTEPKLVYDLLKSMQTTTEEGVDFPDSYSLREAIEYISKSGSVTQNELAILEFSYLPIYEDSRFIPYNLKEELLSRPQMFVELIIHAYKPEGKNTSINNDFQSNELLNRRSWQVLNYGRGVPGERKNQTIDENQFNEWITEARKIGRDHDCETKTDYTIGQWLSKCPAEEEGVWPCYLVCELLELSDAEEIRQGFVNGVRYKRGITSRTLDEGGRQEKLLSNKYRSYADKIRNTYSKTTILLENMAKDYEFDARRQDDEVSIRNEIE